jgi:hypothetical protein
MDCAIRIGPLEAEVAAEEGRELTDLDKLLFVKSPYLGETDMIRTLIAANLVAFAVTTFAPVFVLAASDQAQAQPAADRKTQPGSGQCRLSNGQKC